MATTIEANAHFYAFKDGYKSYSDEDRAFQRKYYKELYNYYGSHPKIPQNTKKPWTKAKIYKITQLIKKCMTQVHKKSLEKYWLSRYGIVKYLGKEYLVMKRQKQGNVPVNVVPLEKYFDILLEVYKKLNKPKMNVLAQSIRNKVYIPIKAIEIFIEVSSRPKKKQQRLSSKRLWFEQFKFNDLGRLDLINFESCADGEYKWLMTYQDYATQFLHLRPLKTKHSNEIAQELIKIFLEFGPPSTLVSMLKISFIKILLKIIEKQWPECKITIVALHGHKIDMIRKDREIKGRLQKWMTENSSTNWSLGCYFIQHEINKLQCCIIENSPNCAVFGGGTNSLFL